MNVRLDDNDAGARIWHLWRLAYIPGARRATVLIWDWEDVLYRKLIWPLFW